MPSDPYSLSSLDRGLFPPRRDFLEPLTAGPASDRGFERTTSDRGYEHRTATSVERGYEHRTAASVERGFEHRTASFHPPASHLSAATSQPSQSLVASQIGKNFIVHVQGLILCTLLSDYYMYMLAL